MEDVFDMLNKLGQRVAGEFYFIDCGGCCVYAALVAQHLQFVTQTRIVVSDDETFTSITDLRERKLTNTVSDWNNNGLYFGHVLVEFDYNGRTYVCDSSGVHEKSFYDPTYDFPYIEGYFTVEEATAFAEDNDRRAWNPSFNRNNIPALKDMIDEAFSSFFKRNVKSTFDMSTC